MRSASGAAVVARAIPQAPKPPPDRHKIAPSHTGGVSPGVSRRRSAIDPRTPAGSTRALNVSSQAWSSVTWTSWQTTVECERLAKVTTSTSALPAGSRTRKRVVSSAVSKS